MPTTPFEPPSLPFNPCDLRFAHSRPSWDSWNFSTGGQLVQRSRPLPPRAGADGATLLRCDSPAGAATSFRTRDETATTLCFRSGNAALVGCPLTLRRTPWPRLRDLPIPAREPFARAFVRCILPFRTAIRPCAGLQDVGGGLAYILWPRVRVCRRCALCRIAGSISHPRQSQSLQRPIPPGRHAPPRLVLSCPR